MIWITCCINLGCYQWWFHEVLLNFVSNRNNSHTHDPLPMRGGRPKTVETKEEGKFSMTCNLMPLWNSKSISTQFLGPIHILSNIAAIKVSSIMCHVQETDLGNDLRPRWREIKWLYGVESGETILVGHNTEDHEHGAREKTPRRKVLTLNI